MPQIILGRIARDRAGLTKFTVFTVLILLFSTSVQTAVFPTHRWFGAIPDLTLCAVFCISCFFGNEAAGIAGISGGFLLDAVGGSGWTVLPLAYFLAGWFFGISAKNIGAEANFLQYLTLLIPLGLYRAALTGILTVVTNGFSVLPQAIAADVLPELLATVLAGIVLYFPVRLIVKKMRI